MEHSNACPDFGQDTRKCEEKYTAILVKKNPTMCPCRLNVAHRIQNSFQINAENVVCVDLGVFDEHVFRIIISMFENVRMLKLNADNQQFILPHLPKVQELEIIGDVGVEQFECIVESVPNLECIALTFNNDHMKLLEKMTSLKSVWFYQVPPKFYTELNCLKNLPKLTKLNIGVNDNGSCILKILSQLRLGLLELKLHVRYDAETFEQIQKFEKLKSLSLETFTINPILSTSLLENHPRSLHTLGLIGAKLSLCTFGTLITKLTSLEEVDLGNGDIVDDSDVTISELNDKNFVILIDKWLDEARRIMKIKFRRQAWVHPYQSSRLKMICTNNESFRQEGYHIYI